MLPSESAPDQDTPTPVIGATGRALEDNDPFAPSDAADHDDPFAPSDAADHDDPFAPSDAPTADDPFAPAPAAGISSVLERRGGVADGPPVADPSPAATPATEDAEVPQRHVMLWLPQALGLGYGPGGKNAGKGVRLLGPALLVYLHLVATRHNDSLRVTVHLSEIAKRCGLGGKAGPTTVRAALTLLERAGYIKAVDFSTTRYVIPRPRGDKRFQIPLAAVWPTAGAGPRWGADSPLAVRTLLALVAAADFRTGRVQGRTARQIADRAGMSDTNFTDGLVLLLGKGEPGGVRHDEHGEIVRDAMGRALVAERRTDGGWLVSTPLRVRLAGRRKDVVAGRNFKQGESLYVIDWSRLPQATSMEPRTTAAPEIEGTGTPEIEGTGTPEIEGTGTPEIECTREPGTPDEQLPLRTDAASYQPAIRAAGPAQPGSDREEEPSADERQTNESKDKSNCAEDRRQGPGQVQPDVTNVDGRSKAKGHVKGQPDSAEAVDKVNCSPKSARLRDALLAVGSGGEAREAAAAAVRAAGGRDRLSASDQAALVLAHVEHAPAHARLALAPAEVQRLTSAVRKKIDGGWDPLVLAEALTTGLAKGVDCPIAVLLGRLRLAALGPARPQSQAWVDCPTPAPRREPRGGASDPGSPEWRELMEQTVRDGLMTRSSR